MSFRTELLRRRLAPIDLRWYDTDLDYAECGFSANCDGGLVGKIVWNLPRW